MVTDQRLLLRRGPFDARDEAVFDATYEKPGCEAGGDDDPGSEELMMSKYCLHVDVYAPAHALPDPSKLSTAAINDHEVDRRELLPVFVYFAGSCFAGGLIQVIRGGMRYSRSSSIFVVRLGGRVEVSNSSRNGS